MKRMKSSKDAVAGRAGISRRHLAYILAGEKNAAPRTATALQSVTGIPREVWVFGSAAQRMRAWEEYLAGATKTEEQP